MKPERSHRHFHDELDELQTRLVQMGGMAENQVRLALDALLARDVEKAEEVTRRDEEIDALEIEIDERTLELLALQQPMAVDLRLIYTVLKISNDLERVGDHAVNVGNAVRRLGPGAPLGEMREIREMAAVSVGMLADALASFVARDAALARGVCARDDRLDNLRNSVARLLIGDMLEDPSSDSITSDLELLLVSHNLERTGDLATNIAEDVVFLVEGRSIKHRVEVREDG